MQDHAADQLHVEVALAEGALGGFAHGGEGRHQDVVERLARRRAVCVNSAVRAFRASSDSAATSGSSALMASTRGLIAEDRRSLAEPNNWWCLRQKRAFGHFRVFARTVGHGIPVAHGVQRPVYSDYASDK